MRHAWLCALYAHAFRAAMFRDDDPLVGLGIDRGRAVRGVHVRGGLAPASTRVLSELGPSVELRFANPLRETVCWLVLVVDLEYRRLTLLDAPMNVAV